MDDCGCRHDEFQTILCETHWDALMARLEEPPKVNPALAELVKRHRRFVQSKE